MKKHQRDCYDHDECINMSCSECGTYEANHENCDCPDCHEAKNDGVNEGVNEGVRFLTDDGQSDCPIFPI